MKLKKIVTNDIKKCHPNQNPCQTDQYYQRLANRLQDGFCSLGKIIEERTAEVMHSTPVKCAFEGTKRPRSTLRRVYTTPRGVTPAFVLDY